MVLVWGYGESDTLGISFESTPSILLFYSCPSGQTLSILSPSFSPLRTSTSMVTDVGIPAMPAWYAQVPVYVTTYSTKAPAAAAAATATAIASCGFPVPGKVHQHS